jgi:hypothetical protein
MTNRMGSSITAGLLVCAISSSASAVTFTRVADTSTLIPGGSGAFTEFHIDNAGLGGGPSIHDGQVAFLGSGNGQQGIYTWSGGLTRVVDTTLAVPGGTGCFSSFGHPSIDSGQVVFQGKDSLGYSGIYSNKNGLHAIATTATPIPGGTGLFTGVGAPSIDSQGVAFHGGGSSAQHGVYTDIGGLHVVANRNTPVPNGYGKFYSFGGAVLDGGHIAFYATGGGGDYGIYTDVGGQLRRVADTKTPVPGGTGDFMVHSFPAISQGHIAFAGKSYREDEGVFVDVDGTLTVVANDQTYVPGTSERFMEFVQYTPTIDGTNVVFQAESLNRSGIYGSFGGNLIKLIELSDTLDGRTVTNLFMSVEALDGDQFVFRAWFQDGSEGIYIATVPEPATICLLVLAGFVMPVLRRKSC